MLTIFDDIRKILSAAMLPSIHKRIVLYGYGYTGRFLRWYAEYYHSIKVDYIISLDMKTGQSYENEIYRPTLLSFDYKDSMNAVVWLAVPLDEQLKEKLERYGYQAGDNLVDFYSLVYGDDISWGDVDSVLPFEPLNKRKTGIRDIQFLEWLEWKNKCDFVTAIQSDQLSSNGNSYKVTTQKEIFPILDKCHIGGDIQDGIFDYGCGKGGAMISFLDYGFKKVGGVEQDSGLFKVLVDNMDNLDVQRNADLELINNDATEVKNELDKYSWFYFFDPFGDEVFYRCMCNIQESLHRKKRKTHIIFINPHCYKEMAKFNDFQLINQFIVSMRQKVVNVWESL